MPLLAIIVPCYNEFERLDTAAFIEFAELNKNFIFYFINDGSTDNTAQKLETLYQQNKKQINIIHLKKNRGKGEAIRSGILEALKKDFEFIAFTDADLATPPAEFSRLYGIININTSILFASRIKKAGAVIKRSSFRHFTGRTIATIIDSTFQLGIYDTQCGTKFFHSNILKKVVAEPFLTSWFFDVEIFLRTRKYFPDFLWQEEPLAFWRDDGKSRLNFFSSIKIAKELIVLLKNY